MGALRRFLMKRLRPLLQHGMLSSLSVLFMLPLYLMVSLSLKTPAEIESTSPWSWPQTPQLANYQTVLSDPTLSFFRLLNNTLTISILSMIGTVLSSAMAAYAFARLEFRGRDRLFIMIVATMMLPGIVTTIPSYMLFASIGWINSSYPLWVPSFLFAGAFNIFLLRQFFFGIPKELDEAAILDGATHVTIFSRIILPLSGPGLATVAVFAFVGSWRDFLGPLLYLNSPSLQTLEVGLASYRSVQSTEWHLVMAASVLVMVPIAIIFIAFQKFFVSGIVMTGGK